MKHYKNLGGFSSVIQYKIADQSIEVMFRDKSVYTYSYTSAGRENVEKMKQLAEQGKGLCTFINKNVNEEYESKSRG